MRLIIKYHLWAITCGDFSLNPISYFVFVLEQHWSICLHATCSGARCSSVVRAFAHNAMGSSDRCFMVDPMSYFSFQPVLHDWCNKGRGMCYPVCGMMHIKEPLLLIGKSSPCGGSGFPFSLSLSE